MSTPRSLLRTFLVNRFKSEGSLKRFVEDNLGDVSAEINWHNSLVECAESLVATLSDRGLTGLWPALLQERSEYANEIRAMEQAWKAAAAGNITTALLPSAPAATLVDRETLTAIFRAAREARLQDSRAALFAGLPSAIRSAMPPVADPRGQLLADLDALNQLAGDPPPLRLWLENAELLQESDGRRAVFSAFLDALPTADEPADEPDDDMGDDMEDNDAAVTEALAAIVLEQRPAFLVTHGRLEALPPAWDHLEPARAKVDYAIAATGRFDTEGAENSLWPWLGCGAVVGEDLVCTARHMANTFFSGIRRDAPAARLLFDPRRDEAPASGSTPFEVAELLLRHPVLDLALLRVPGLSAAGIRPLTSAAGPPRLGAEVARVTYVGQDNRVDVGLQQRLFRGKLDGAKWVLPGRVTRLPSHTEGATDIHERLVAYDTNTLGGTGGPLIEVATGHMVGTSVMRLYLNGNWAVPAWEMIRDPRIRDLGVVVAPAAPPADDPWASAWRDDTSQPNA